MTGFTPSSFRTMARLLASGAADHSLCLWNIAQQKPEFQLPACKNAIAAISMHPNNQQLAVVGFSGEMEIVNASTGQASQKMDGPCVDIRTVAFSPNGERMAAAGRNGKIRVWNVSDAQGPARHCDRWPSHSHARVLAR